MKNQVFSTIFIFTCLIFSGKGFSQVLVEAESFSNKGGAV